MAYSDQVKQRAIELGGGRSAREVQRLLEREFPNESSTPDERTIRRWRATLSTVHTEQEQARIASVQDSWRAHNEQLLNITNMLLANSLGKVLEGYTSSGKHEYAVTGSIYEDFYEVTEEQLSTQLEQNIEYTIHDHTEWFFYECFVPHLAMEFSEEMKTKGFWGMVKEQPYKLIETLRVLAARKTFKGTCPVCKDWH
jgi:hypothetical protein